MSTKKPWYKKLFNFKSPKTIAVIPMKGIIGNIGPRKSGICFESHHEYIEKAFNLKKLTAVALLINSPGGSPVQSEMIFKYITSLKKEKKIPVWVFVEDIAASGGYYIACSADKGKLIVAENSIVGSIGVISSGFGFVDLIKKIGVERRVYTQGESKNILDPFSPPKTEDIEMLKDMQADVHENFKRVVISARGEKDEEIFSGKVWSGIKSIELGLADKNGYMQDILKQEYGKDIKYIKFEAKKSKLLSKLGFDVISENILLKIKESFIWEKFGL